MSSRAFSSLLPALAIPVLLGCEQVAGVTHHELAPADAEPSVDQNPWGAIPEECNFADDNHDGNCDEGFVWKVGPWTLVYTGTSIQSVDGVRLPDGKLTALVLEGTDQSASSHAALVTLDSEAVLVSGPADVWKDQGTLGSGVASTADGEVGVGRKPAVQDCDAGSCPITVHRFRGADLSAVGTTVLERSANYPDLVETQRLWDLAWTGAGYVALASDPDGFARLVWENPQGTFFDKTWNGLIDETKPYAGSLAVGPLLGYGLYRDGAGGQQEVVGGLSTLGAYRQVLRPVTVQTSGGGLSMIAPGGRRTAVWSGGDLVVMAVIDRADGVRSTRYGRIRVDGQMTFGPGLTPESYSITGADDRIMVVTVATDGFEIVRFGRSLQQVGTAISVGDAADLAIVATGGIPMLLRVSADRTQVHAAALRCE